MTQSDIPSTL